eukprot:Rmarinus@m.17319
MGKLHRRQERVIKFTLDSILNLNGKTIQSEIELAAVEEVFVDPESSCSVCLKCKNENRTREFQLGSPVEARQMVDTIVFRRDAAMQAHKRERDMLQIDSLDSYYRKISTGEWEGSVLGSFRAESTSSVPDMAVRGSSTSFVTATSSMVSGDGTATGSPAR